MGILIHLSFGVKKHGWEIRRDGESPAVFDAQKIVQLQ